MKIKSDQLKSEIAKFREKALSTIDKGREFAAKDIARELPSLILQSIAKGISPVKGEGRFVDYSDSYKDQITKTTSVIGSRGKKRKFLTQRSLGARYGKRLRPVNLKLSGNMLDSIYSKASKFSAFIGFKNPIAYYHTVTGPGGNLQKVRKLLPSKGEGFSLAIFRVLREILKKHLPLK